MASSRFNWTLALGVTAVAFTLHIGFKLIHDGDTDMWMHLASGRHFIETGGIAYTPDPFSYASDRPWVPLEWGFAILSFLMVQTFGIDIVIYARWALLLINLGLLYCLISLRFHIERRVAVSVWLACLLGLAVSVQFLHFRPHLVGYTMLLGFLCLLDRFQAGNISSRMFLISLAILQMFWANLHASFVLCSLTLGVASVATILANRFHAHCNNEGGQPLTVEAYVPPLLVSLVTPLMNPVGLELVLHPLEYLRDHQLWHGIREHQPPDLLHQDFPWLQILIVLDAVSLMLLILCRWRGTRRTLQRRWFDLIMVTFWTWEALHSARHVPILSFFMLPALGTQIRRWIEFLTSHLEASRVLRATGPLAAFCALIVFVWSLRAYVPVDRCIRWETFPTDACRFIVDNRLPNHDDHLKHSVDEKHLPGCANIFTIYEWGGYLDWVLPDYRIFIDGRAVSAYNDHAFVTFNRILYAAPDWRNLLEQTCTDIVMLPTTPQSKLQAELDRDPDWPRVFTDLRATVYVRRTVANADFLQSLQRGAPILPNSPFQDCALGVNRLMRNDIAAAIDLLQKAVDRYPQYSFGHVQLGMALAQLGRVDDAALHWRAALSYDPTTPNAHYNLAIYALQHNEIKTARKELEAELSLEPDNPTVLKKLAELNLK